MSAPTTNERPRPKADRGNGEQRSRVEEASDRLSLAAARSADPEGATKYADLYRTALRDALDEIGSPADSGVLTLAASRAASRTWDLVRLHALDGERVRLEVLREEGDRLGVGPLRAGLAPGLHPTSEPGVFHFPRAEVREDEKVRRGGRRR